MDEQRKYAMLFAATILAARKLYEIGDRPCPARECAIADAIENAKRILEKIDERWTCATRRSSPLVSLRHRSFRKSSLNDQDLSPPAGQRLDRTYAVL
jgi:hypothetical protein